MTAWQWFYYQRDREEIEERNPDFADCPLFCHDETLRPAASCRECPVKQATEAFHADCREFLQARVFRAAIQRWSDERLIQMVERIANVEAEVGTGRVSENWTLVTARLVSIFRHERYKQRLIDDFNRRQQRGDD